MKKFTKKLLKEVESKCFYEFKDKALLEKSLTHKSYVNEAKENGLENNERLEFLGDAVLNLLSSELLMKCYPTTDEGILSKRRSAIVNEKTLARIARKISLGSYLLLGKGEELTNGREKDSLLANTLEALMGAIYQDGGVEEARNFIARYFKGLVKYSSKKGSYKDYKTLAQELAQKIFKRTPEYRLTNVSGPDHAKTFESEFRVGADSFGKGRGRSKKDSEQKCAKMAIKKLEKLL